MVALPVWWFVLSCMTACPLMTARPFGAGAGTPVATSNVGLSVTLNDSSLSEEAKRLRVTGVLNTVILSEAASQNFERGMSEQRAQSENLKR